MARPCPRAVILLLAFLLRSTHAEPIPLPATITATPAATMSATPSTANGSAPSTVYDPDSVPSSAPTINPVTAGASGSGSGLVLSTGAIIGICVAMAIFIIAIVVLWFLWFTAKRRNWAVRDTLKYASRRMTGRGAVPPTPRTPGMPRVPYTPRPDRGNGSNMAIRAGGGRGNRGVTMYAGKGGSRGGGGDVERNVGRPKVGWLAGESEVDEKGGSSGSRSPASRGRTDRK